MSGNSLQSTSRIVASGDEADKPVPPFWELEDLLTAGVDREAALVVMASRRRRPTLALKGKGRPAGRIGPRFGASLRIVRA